MSKVNSKNILKLKDEVPHTLFHNYKQQISSPISYTNGLFGFRNSLTTNGDGTIIAIGQSTGGTSTGYVVIYKRIKDRFTLLQTITAPDGIIGQYFAPCCLSMNGKILVVGSYYASVNGLSQAGKISIFSNNSPGSSSSSWTFLQELTQPVPLILTKFGYSVACSVDGTYIVAGSLRTGVINDRKDTVAIFKRDSLNKFTWSFVQALNSNLRFDSNSTTTFGFIISISIDAKYIIVADLYDSQYLTEAGAIYLFYNSNPIGCRNATPTTWTLLRKITAVDAAGGAQFGSAVSISADNNTIAVGAYFNNPFGNLFSGSVYIYNTLDNWSNYTETQIVPSDPTGSYTSMGTAVLLSHDAKYCIAGAFHNSDSTSGLVYIWKRNGMGIGTSSVIPTWKLHQKIIPPDDTTQNAFGFSVVGTSDIKHLVIGTPFSDPSGITNSGAVYYFNSVDGYPLHNVVQYDSTSVSGTITLTNRNNVLIVKATLTGSLTINLPTDLINGKQVYIHIKNGGTQALTFLPVVIGWTNTTTIGTFQVFSLIYVASANAWYRI